MERGTSHLVWAERFTLLELKSQREGTYNLNGSKKSQGANLVVRSFAVARNAVNNSEIYIFDENKTDEINIIREANIIKNVEEENKKNISSEDAMAAALVKALGKATGTPTPEKTIKEDTLEDLKIIIKDNDLGIRISKGDSREKVETKIKEAQK